MSGDADALPAHRFWREILAPGTLDVAPAAGFRDRYPATLPDGRQLALPIRERVPGREALASLIVNQASFAVQDALADALTVRVRAFAPDVVVGVPTLGLGLADGVARRLGHERCVPLGTSRKFWYDEALSAPMVSVTSPGQEKRLYLDPRLRPLLDGARVLLVDDVISTGGSIEAALRVLATASVEPVGIGCAMLQGPLWRERLGSAVAGRTVGVLATPLLGPRADGGWEVGAP